MPEIPTAEELNPNWDYKEQVKAFRNRLLSNTISILSRGAVLARLKMAGHARDSYSRGATATSTIRNMNPAGFTLNPGDILVILDLRGTAVCPRSCSPYRILC